MLKLIGLVFFILIHNACALYCNYDEMLTHNDSISKCEERNMTLLHANSKDCLNVSDTQVWIHKEFNEFLCFIIENGTVFKAYNCSSLASYCCVTLHFNDTCTDNTNTEIMTAQTQNVVNSDKKYGYSFVVIINVLLILFIINFDIFV